jgi:hypothetical protein
MVFQIYRETISGGREIFFDIEYWIDVANRDDTKVYRPKIKVRTNTPALMNTMLYNKEDMYIQDTTFICDELENSLIKPYFNIDDWKEYAYLKVFEKDIEPELRAILNRYCNKYGFLINVD